MAQAFWHVRRCSLFEQLDAVQLGRLERQSRVRNFPRGNSIYLPSDSSGCIYLLAEGRVRLSSTTPDGKLVILGFIESGEVFGELALVDDGHREERADAMTKTTVVMLTGDSMQQLMNQSAQLTLKVTKLIGLRRRRVERRLKNLLFRSNRDRLAMLLVDLLDQYGQPDPDGELIGIKLSQQDLASLIGATRESVTHLLGDMQRAGIVLCSRQKIVVRDYQRLCENIDRSGHAPSDEASSQHSKDRDDHHEFDDFKQATS